MSFLKRFLKPKRICTVCGQEKEIVKQFRDGRGHYFYCEECNDKIKAKVTKPALDFLKKQMKQGKKISIQDVKDLANKLAKK